MQMMSHADAQNTTRLALELTPKRRDVSPTTTSTTPVTVKNKKTTIMIMITLMLMMLAT
jgi:hypothetical protein